MNVAIGLYVCDVHDGIPPQWSRRIDVCESWEQSDFGPVIQKMVRETVPDFNYVNKHLVIVGENRFGNLIAMCSYDNSRVYFVTFNPE